MNKNPRSQEAWERFQHVLPKYERRVTDAIAERPSTCEELEGWLGIIHQTCSAVMNGLMKKGVIEPSGVTRVNRSGRKADVYQIRGRAPVKRDPDQTALF